MFAGFFIHRPVFAIVISLVIIIVGALAIVSLPIAQYPQISPPTVSVKATYVGASAKVVEESVAIPIEKEVNGVENMSFMSSRCMNDGSYSLTCTFEVGTDLDIAAVQVQNRVSKAQARLPVEVNNFGVSVDKESPDLLMVVSVYSPDESYDSLYLSNYTTINLLDSLSRVKGVGGTQLIGQRDYSMRIWLRPDKMAKLGLTASDVAGVIREQNVQAPAGPIGAPPAPLGTEFQYTVNVKGRLAEVEEYDSAIVRTLPNGSVLRMRDVARTELGAQDYTTIGRLNGNPATVIMIKQLPTANALDVAQGVRDTLDELSENFPPGIEYAVNMDMTLFISESIKEVLTTLFAALALVLLVVFVFLGSFRTTIIPMLAVPVSLIGAFAFFVPLGFSINTLSLFGIVLAIGIVVDDAIVVVEAVENHIDSGLTPVAATEKAMEEVSGPVIATTLVLIAVFVPVAFMGGLVGQLYRQFALTISVAVIISSIAALTLTPALCAMLLKKDRTIRGPVGWFINWFNRVFSKVAAGYMALVRRAVKYSVVTLLVLVLAYVGIWVLLGILPTGFVPSEDLGFFFAQVILPDGASLQRTDAILENAEEVLGGIEGVQDVVTLGGYGLIDQANTSNQGSFVVVLYPWDQRTSEETQLATIMGKARVGLNQWPEALALVFNSPPIPGLGTTGGFEFMLQDRAGRSVEELAEASTNFTFAANERPELEGMYNTFRANIPQLFVELDRDKTKTLGIPVNTVFESLQTYLGGLLVNDFNIFGRVYKVKLQAEPRFRLSPSSIGAIFVRSAAGAMVPLSTLTEVNETFGPDLLARHNLFRAAKITGAAAPGFSSGQGIQAMEEVAAANLPSGFGYEWTGTAAEEKKASGQQAIILLLAFVFVFLVLAAQYESWAIPFGVILGIPLGVLGALLAILTRGLMNDVYVQVGLIVLVGLAAKNAILIVEFSKMRRDQGSSPEEAALEASELRFRPILMTAISFVFGVLPLVVSTGAGAASRHSLGTAVLGGMLMATVLGVFLIPVLYVVIERAVIRFRGEPVLEAPEPRQEVLES